MYFLEKGFASIPANWKVHHWFDGPEYWIKIPISNKLWPKQINLSLSKYVLRRNCDSKRSLVLKKMVWNNYWSSILIFIHLQFDKILLQFLYFWLNLQKALISLKSVSIDRKKSRKYQYFNINSFTSQTLKLGNIAKIRLKLTTFDKALFWALILSF